MRFPVAGALLAYVGRTARLRNALLLTAGAVHTLMVAFLWRRPHSVALGGWLASDALGLMVLTVVSILFLAISTYAVGFLKVEFQS